MTDHYLGDLLEAVDYLPEQEKAQVKKAYFFAKKAHEGQYRAQGDPFVSHPVAVACILAKMRLDSESIQAALLHDTLEDTQATEEELLVAFGQVVLDLVDGVTKLTKIKYSSRLELQAESLRKMLLAMVKDIRVLLVKLADRLHNMRTVDALSTEKRRRVSKQTLEIYAQLAKRLGMHELGLELEDLGFKGFYPMRYRILQTHLQTLQGVQENMLVQVKQSLEEACTRHQVSVLSIVGREKHIYSLYRKMRDKKVSFKGISDVFALRIVVEDFASCYLALGVVHQVYKPIPGRFKDYISRPKANGYQSLHTVLFGPYSSPIEVQIRTKEMDALAMNGLSSHWSYKADQVLPSSKEVQNQAWLSRLVAIQQEFGNSFEFLENIKIDLYPDEIYVFTPKGDIVELPQGATVMDFAYAIDEDIGAHCIAARVDRSLVPLSTVLTNGVSVEIMTAETAVPSPAWLHVVVTPKARHAIKRDLSKKKEEQASKAGQRWLTVALGQVGLPKTLTVTQQGRLAQLCAFKSYDELLLAIGKGECLLGDVIRHAKTLGKISGSSDVFFSKDAYQIEGNEGSNVEYAQCCLPIPRDPIIAVCGPEAVIQVHRQECSILKKRQDKALDQCIEMVWREELQGTFQSRIQTKVINERGVLATLALTISDAQSSIEDIQIGKTDGRFTAVTLLVTVKDLIHLNKIIRVMERLSVVAKAERIYG